jgi:hypothetical protein
MERSNIRDTKCRECQILNAEFRSVRKGKPSIPAINILHPILH